MDRLNAEILALKALNWAATVQGTLPRFVAHSGVELDDLRRQAGDPELLAALLDFLDVVPIPSGMDALAAAAYSRNQSIWYLQGSISLDPFWFELVDQKSEVSSEPLRVPANGQHADFVEYFVRSFDGRDP